MPSAPLPLAADLRLRPANDRPLRPDGEFVLYWMIATRRLAWNFALDRAIALAREFRRPLVVLEPLRAGYRYASPRIHRFVLDGMAANRRTAAGRPITYFPYVEPAAGDGKGLLAVLARRAVAVVTDETPAFFLPRMVAAAARTIEARLEAVDSIGLLPLAATDSAPPTAYAFRRVLQRRLPGELSRFPAESPLSRLELPRMDLPAVVDGARRWEPASAALLDGSDTESGASLAGIELAGDVPPAPLHGGAAAAERRLDAFLAEGLTRYADERSHPDADAGSGLSPYLHFGHVSVHHVLRRLGETERWSPEDVARSATGAREGWWRMSKPAEAFLDELVTWREVGHHFAARRAGSEGFETLPDWARATLAKHGGDAREWRYDRETLAAASTHDPLWNAAQRQLLAEGRIHNYLRMLWGKKVLEWSASPEEALATLFELNDRWALDGRDPNSMSGITWCFGRFDRPWGPEREIFGTVRYMSSANTARKLHVKRYLERWGEARGQLDLV